MTTDLGLKRRYNCLRTTPRQKKEKVERPGKAFPKRTTRLLEECQPQLARRVVLGGGVPLVGPQEELRSLIGFTPWGFTSRPKAGG